MKKINILYCVLCVILMSSCYEDYTKDYNYSTAYFASQKPLRTVIADRDMQIRVGVAIGGKREVDMNDWAEFEIDPALLTGTGLEVLPKEYYTITFTNAFYEDVACTENHYALPFRVKSSSLDKILEGQDYSIVAVKYISTYHGTYYIKGKVSELDASGGIVSTESYGKTDLSKNDTREVSTLAKNVLLRQGIGNNAIATNEKVKMTFQSDHKVKVETADGGIEITEGSGTFNDSGENLEISLKYRYTKSGKKYEVEETLIRRQDPLKDLRYEEW